MNSFKMAIRSINSNKMRAALTMLGIIIGVMALVVLVSIVDGTTDSIGAAISSLGSDLISVSVMDDKGKPLSMELLNEWVDNDTDIGNIAPTATGNGIGKYGSTSDNFTIYGVTPSYFDIQKIKVNLGRTLKQTDVDNNSRVCVINNDTATNLIGYEDCIGEELSVNGMKFTIVGVQSKEESMFSSLMSMMGGNYTVYIPYTSLVRISENVTTSVNRFYAAPPEGKDVHLTKTALEEKMLQRFGDTKAYSVYLMGNMQETMSTIKSVLSLMLGGIAAISLIVGGIGIMNIMMVTVTERTREIGIRKAIGASRGTILRQFLMEAVVLCMLGCAAGILLSWSILRLASVIASDLDIKFVLNQTVCVVAVGFCFLIGIVFGLHPANKAAKMKPIDALHYGG